MVQRRLRVAAGRLRGWPAAERGGGLCAPNGSGEPPRRGAVEDRDRAQRRRRRHAAHPGRRRVGEGARARAQGEADLALQLARRALGLGRRARATAAADALVAAVAVAAAAGGVAGGVAVAVRERRHDGRVGRRGCRRYEARSGRPPVLDSLRQRRDTGAEPVGLWAEPWRRERGGGDRRRRRLSAAAEPAPLRPQRLRGCSSSSRRPPRRRRRPRRRRHRRRRRPSSSARTYRRWRSSRTGRSRRRRRDGRSAGRSSRRASSSCASSCWRRAGGRSRIGTARILRRGRSGRTTTNGCAHRRRRPHRRGRRPHHERVRNPHAGKDWVPLDVPEPDLPSRAEPSSYGMDAYNSRGSTKPATADSGKERLLEGETNNEEAQKEFRRPTKTVGAGGDPYFQNIGPSSPRGGGAPTEQRMSCTPRLMSVPDLGGTSEMPPEPPPRGRPSRRRGEPAAAAVADGAEARLGEAVGAAAVGAAGADAGGDRRAALVARGAREILSPEAEVGGTSDVPPPVPPRASAPAVPPLSIAELRMGRTSKEVSAEESITGKEIGVADLRPRGTVEERVRGKGCG